MAYETEKIEFKSNILGDIYKEIIAFAKNPPALYEKSPNVTYCS